MFRFENQVVLITGGSSVIGLCAARSFVTEGAQVVLDETDSAFFDQIMGT